MKAGEKLSAAAKWLFYRFLYRRLMKLTHRYHWHYAPPIYPEGDTHLWCQWCGFRQTIRRASLPSSVIAGTEFKGSAGQPLAGCRPHRETTASTLSATSDHIDGGKI